MRETCLTGYFEGSEVLADVHRGLHQCLLLAHFDGIGILSCRPDRCWCFPQETLWQDSDHDVDLKTEEETPLVIHSGLEIEVVVVTLNIEVYEMIVFLETSE